MFMEVSNIINDRISLQESQSDFRNIINGMETDAILDEFVDFLGNGEYRNMYNYFEESTQHDADLETGLQDEAWSDDNAEWNQDPDIDDDDLTFLQEPRDYNDNFKSSYEADSLPNNFLSKEIMYNDTTTTPVNIDEFSNEAADFYLEDMDELDECGDGSDDDYQEDYFDEDYFLEGDDDISDIPPDQAQVDADGEASEDYFYEDYFDEEDEDITTDDSTSDADPDVSECGGNCDDDDYQEDYFDEDYFDEEDEDVTTDDSTSDADPDVGDVETEDYFLESDDEDDDDSDDDEDDDDDDSDDDDEDDDDSDEDDDDDDDEDDDDDNKSEDFFGYDF